MLGSCSSSEAPYPRVGEGFRAYTANSDSVLTCTGGGPRTLEQERRAYVPGAGLWARWGRRAPERPQGGTVTLPTTFGQLVREGDS